jgi:hypothetical protein|tara:strand:+ start:97 stop:357 length:261 start_codon:yes stop_codon:yes gene_type:complete
MSVLPRTSLGYTLGIRRDKNIYGQGERAQANPFEQSRTRTRMAGDKKVDLYSSERDYLATPYVRGDYLPNRFVSSLPSLKLEEFDD